MGNNKKGQIPYTATEQIKNGKRLNKAAYIYGRSSSETMIKSMLRKSITNDEYEGKTKGIIKIVSPSIDLIDRPWTDGIPSFLGGTQPEAQYIYHGKAIDDSRHDGCGESESIDDNIYQTFPKFHVAEGLLPGYNDQCRVRYYDTNRNFVGVVGIITEIIGDETNSSDGPSRGGRRPAPGKREKPRGRIPNPSSITPPSSPIYPYNPVNGKPVKTASEIVPFVTSFSGPRDLALRGASTDHPGLDLEASIGQKIYAAMDGEIAAKLDSNDPAAKKGYGYYVAIKTTGLDGLGPIYTLYGHLGKDVLGRFPRTFGGKTIKAGAQIGTMMNTGNSTGPHLHFGVVYGSNLTAPAQVALGHAATVFDPMSEFFGRVYSRS